MNKRICDAIHNQNILKFTYHGHPRIVEPYAYGLSRQGNEVIRCYQTGGVSDSGEVPHWKLFEVDEIESLIVLKERFAHANTEYRKGDKHMTTIFCEL